VIFVYDFLYLEISGLVLWPAIAFTVVFNLFFDWGKVDFGNNALNLATYSGALGATVAFTFFFLLVAVSKEKWMGMGDAYLVILLGLILGWPQILLGLMLAFSLGALSGIVLMLLKKKNMNSQIPFAPFLVLGSLITMFWYGPIMGWYLGLF
jgi:prepilin signal peptidase PulO-like enzyme (type II secretory pathway)